MILNKLLRNNSEIDERELIFLVKVISAKIFINDEWNIQNFYQRILLRYTKMRILKNYSVITKIITYVSLQILYKLMNLFISYRLAKRI